MSEHDDPPPATDDATKAADRLERALDRIAGASQPPRGASAQPAADPRVLGEVTRRLDGVIADLRAALGPI